MVEEEARVRDFWQVRREGSGGRRADLGMEEVVEAWRARVGGRKAGIAAADEVVKEVRR